MPKNNECQSRLRTPLLVLTAFAGGIVVGAIALDIPRINQDRTSLVQRAVNKRHIRVQLSDSPDGIIYLIRDMLKNTSYPPNNYSTVLYSADLDENPEAQLATSLATWEDLWEAPETLEENFPQIAAQCTPENASCLSAFLSGIDAYEQTGTLLAQYGLTLPGLLRNDTRQAIELTLEAMNGSDI